MHGYELKQHLSILTGHFRPISDGALYPAISRLEKQGYLIKRKEPGKAGSPKQTLIITDSGKSELLSRLTNPSDVDISDRNKFFTILAFMRYLEPEKQLKVLERRLDFLKGGKSFFQANGKPVLLSEETDPFRKGMLFNAKETSKVEKKWLKDMIDKLSKEV